MSMRVRLLMLAILSLLALAPAAEAWPAHSGLPCPRGAAYPLDGCANAPPDGVVHFPAFFTAGPTNGVYQTGVARESGQTYAIRPPFNVAGVDYGVAYSPSQIKTSIAAAISAGFPAAGVVNGWKDPAYIGQDPTVSGCSFTPSGGLVGTGSVSCSGSAALDIEDYDFGLHGCTSLFASGNYTGVTVKNNRFVGGPNCINPGVAAGVGYIGDAWYGYIDTAGYHNNNGFLCIATGPNAQGTDPVAGSTISLIGNQGGPWSVVAGNQINADTCAAGYAGYTVSGNFLGDASAGDTPGTAGSPILITAANTTFVAAITNGALSVGLTFQGTTGAGFADSTNTNPTDTIISCSPACGGPGAYTITTNEAEYAPRIPFVFVPNTSMNELVNIYTWSATSVLFTQNLVDVAEVGSLTLAPNNDAAFNINAAGTVTISYNAIMRCACRPIAVTFRGSGPFTSNLLYNYLEEWAMNSNDGHREMNQIFQPDSSQNGGVATVITQENFTGNTFLSTADTADINSGAGILFLNTGTNNNGIVSQANVDYNTAIVNWSYPPPSNNPTFPIKGQPVTAFIRVLDTEYDVLNIHDNFVDGIGMGGAGCVGYPQNSTGSGAANPALSNNVNLITGHVQATDNNSWYNGEPCT